LFGEPDAGAFSTLTDLWQPRSADRAQVIQRTSAPDHYVYALTDYREVDRAIALARVRLDIVRSGKCSALVADAIRNGARGGVRGDLAAL